MRRRTEKRGELFVWKYASLGASQVTLEVKDPPANAGDMGSLPRSGRSLEEGMATHSSILTWRIPWAGEPGWLQSVGSQRVGHN